MLLKIFSFQLVADFALKLTIPYQFLTVTTRKAKLSTKQSTKQWQPVSTMKFSYDSLFT